MSDHVFTLAVWTRELINSLPPDLHTDDDRLFKELIDPNNEEIEAFFGALPHSQAEAFSQSCLDVLAQSGIREMVNAAEEARGAVATLPRQQLSDVAETFAVLGAATVAIVFACRVRRTKVGADGTLELSFFEGLPQGAVEILKLLLGKIKIGRIIDRLRDRANDSDEPDAADQGPNEDQSDETDHDQKE
jgi:hypothetical protein